MKKATQSRGRKIPIKETEPKEILFDIDKESKLYYPQHQYDTVSDYTAPKSILYFKNGTPRLPLHILKGGRRLR